MLNATKTSVEHRQVTIQLRHFVMAQTAIAFVFLGAFSIGLTNTVSAAEKAGVFDTPKTAQVQTSSTVIDATPAGK